MSIQEMLKQVRSDAELSQEEIAERIGVTRQTISNWETGKSYPDIASLIILSDIYGVSLDSLLKGDSKMIKHLEESTNVTKSNRQVIASIIALGIFLLGTIFTILTYGGHLDGFLDWHSLLMIFIPLVLVLTVTRSFKLFASGLQAALFPKKDISEDKCKRAASLYRLLSRTAMIATVISVMIPLIIMLYQLDFASENILSIIGNNFSVVLISPLYGLFMIMFVFEPVVYILRQKIKKDIEK